MPLTRLCHASRAPSRAPGRQPLAPARRRPCACASAARPPCRRRQPCLCLEPPARACPRCCSTRARACMPQPPQRPLRACAAPPASLQHTRSEPQPPAARGRLSRARPHPALPGAALSRPALRSPNVTRSRAGSKQQRCGRTNLNYTGSSMRVHSQGLQRASNGIIPWPVG
jgi:hypothetical protein